MECDVASDWLTILVLNRLVFLIAQNLTAYGKVN
jgi:hypothetical protein